MDIPETSRRPPSFLDTFCACPPLQDAIFSAAPEACVFVNKEVMHASKDHQRELRRVKNVLSPIMYTTRPTHNIEDVLKSRSGATSLTIEYPDFVTKYTLPVTPVHMKVVRESIFPYVILPSPSPTLARKLELVKTLHLENVCVIASAETLSRSLSRFSSLEELTLKNIMLNNNKHVLDLFYDRPPPQHLRQLHVSSVGKVSVSRLPRGLRGLELHNCGLPQSTLDMPRLSALTELTRLVITRTEEYNSDMYAFNIPAGPFHNELEYGRDYPEALDGEDIDAEDDLDIDLNALGSENSDGDDGTGEDEEADVADAVEDAEAAEAGEDEEAEDHAEDDGSDGGDGDTEEDEDDEDILPKSLLVFKSNCTAFVRFIDRSDELLRFAGLTHVHLPTMDIAPIMLPLTVQVLECRSVLKAWFPNSTASYALQCNMRPNIHTLLVKKFNSFDWIKDDGVMLHKMLPGLKNVQLCFDESPVAQIAQTFNIDGATCNFCKLLCTNQLRSLDIRGRGSMTTLMMLATANASSLTRLVMCNIASCVTAPVFTRETMLTMLLSTCTRLDTLVLAGKPFTTSDFLESKKPVWLSTVTPRPPITRLHISTSFRDSRNPTSLRDEYSEEINVTAIDNMCKLACDLAKFCSPTLREVALVPTVVCVRPHLPPHLRAPGPTATTKCCATLMGTAKTLAANAAKLEALYVPFEAALAMAADPVFRHRGVVRASGLPRKGDWL